MAIIHSKVLQTLSPQDRRVLRPCSLTVAQPDALSAAQVESLPVLRLCNSTTVQPHHPKLALLMRVAVVEKVLPDVVFDSISREEKM